jgi:RecA/RadA recombinase
MQDQDLTLLAGLGKRTLKKLQAAGIWTIHKLAATPIKRLQKYKIGEETARKIMKAAQAWCADNSLWVSGDEILEQHRKRQYLSSGTTELDRILRGKGFETGKVYEVYGPPGAGKTNLLFQLICTAFLPPAQGGLDTGTVFIDTEDTFSLPRVFEIARRFSIDPQALRQRIRRTVPPTSDFLIYICETQVEQMMAEVKARFLCLDSLASLLRAEYGTAKDRLPERQVKVDLVLSALRRLAQVTKAVVLLTNQTTVRPNVISSQDAATHALGHVAGHGVPVRLKMRMTNTLTGMCEIKVEKSFDLPPRACKLYLGAKGFTDVLAKN